MKCTWRDCEQPARHEWRDEDGEVWASLCDQHNGHLELAEKSFLAGGEPGAFLAVYVRAQGGSEAVAQRMMRDLLNVRI